VTRYPGLYYTGLPWLHNGKSGLLFGLAEESAYIAARIRESSHSELPIWNTTSRSEVSYEI